MLQRVPPRWTADRAVRRPLRLLIEDDDPALAISDFALYRDAGMEVALCRGPGTERAGCPLLSGGRCEVLSGADVVLHQLDPEVGVAAAIRRSPQRGRLVTVGGPDADLSDVAPVESRIRVVQRHRPTATGQEGTGNGPPDQA